MLCHHSFFFSFFSNENVNKAWITLITKSEHQIQIQLIYYFAKQFPFPSLNVKIQVSHQNDDCVYVQCNNSDLTIGATSSVSQLAMHVDHRHTETYPAVWLGAPHVGDLYRHKSRGAQKANWMRGRGAWFNIDNVDLQIIFKPPRSRIYVSRV